MRIIVRLEALENCPYEYEYHHHLQGLIYNLIKGSKYGQLHDRKGYKFFCMSNIFPAQNLVKGDERTLIVSSPDEDFVKFVASNFSYLSEVRVGRMHFGVRRVRTVRIRLQALSNKLITGTPIVIRIPRERCDYYGIPLEMPYEYVYWRKEYPLTAFVKQVEENLVKKYQEFYGNKIEGEVLPLPQTLLFRKQVSTRLHFEEGTQIVIGTTWEFGFRSLNRDQVRLLEFGLDAGFGEMNTKGFGFMNVIDQSNES